MNSTVLYTCNKDLHSYIYMSPRAGRTTGPTGLTFVEEIYGKHRLKK